MTEPVNELGQLLEAVKDVGKQQDAYIKKHNEESGDLKAKYDDLVKLTAEQSLAIQGMRKSLDEERAARKTPGAIAEKREVEKDNWRTLFKQFLRRGSIDAVDLELRTNMNLTAGADGGFFVAPDYATELTKNLVMISNIRADATVRTIAGERAYFPRRTTNFTATNPAEGAPGTDTKLVIEQVGIQTRSYDVTVPATLELLQDAYLDVEAVIRDCAVEELARFEGYDFVLGAGTAGPLGICHASSGYATITGTDTSAHKTSIVDFATMSGKLNSRYTPGAKWYMNTTTFAGMLSLSSSGNYPFLNGVNGFASASGYVVLGRPVVTCDDILADGTVSRRVVAFGDLAQGYTITDKAGMYVLRDPYSAHGSVSFTFRKWTGGATMALDAVKILVTG